MMNFSFLTVSLLALGVASLPSGLQERQGVQTTRNELVSGPCKAVTVIFGRGSLQPGNVGELVGPPFFIALSDILGAQNVAIQGVDYPATLEQAMAGGSPEGAAELARLANLASTKCPQTRIVLSGYSQGAQIIHLGASQINGGARGKIKAVVVFGDPYNGQAIAGIAPANVKSFCATGDYICNGGTSFDPNAHTSYGKNAVEAAFFAAARLAA